MKEIKTQLFMAKRLYLFSFSSIHRETRVQLYAHASLIWLAAHRDVKVTLTIGVTNVSRISNRHRDAKVTLMCHHP